MCHCSYNCWRFSLHSVCPNLWRKAQTLNRVLPLHLWLRKPKKHTWHMPVVDFLVTFQIVDYWLVWILKRHFERYVILLGFLKLELQLMDWELYGLDLTAAKQVQSKGQKWGKTWCKLTINRLQLSISSQANHSFQRSDLYISRFPQKTSDGFR